MHIRDLAPDDHRAVHAINEAGTPGVHTASLEELAAITRMSCIAIVAEEHGGAGGEKDGAEVSDPNEPAEKEADAVGEKVGDELHDGKKDGADKKDAKGHGKGKSEKEGEDGAEGKEGEKKDAGKVDEKAAPISAKLEGVGRKVFLALDPNAIAKKATAPADRHYIRKVDQSSVKKDKNSVISSTVSVAGDVAAIRSGTATIGKADGGDVSFTVNGRTYGAHPDGTLYPIRGEGIVELDRGAFQALGIYNKFGLTPQAEGILDKIPTDKTQREAAKTAYKLG